MKFSVRSGSVTLLTAGLLVFGATHAVRADLSSCTTGKGPYTGDLADSDATAIAYSLVNQKEIWFTEIDGDLALNASGFSSLGFSYGPVVGSDGSFTAAYSTANGNLLLKGHFTDCVVDGTWTLNVTNPAKTYTGAFHCDPPAAAATPSTPTNPAPTDSGTSAPTTGLCGAGAASMASALPAVFFWSRGRRRRQRPNSPA